MRASDLLLAFGLALVAAAAAFLLARLAPRIGWVDAAERASDRKLQGRAVPPVGGAAILFALALSPWARAAALEPWGPLHPFAARPLLATVLLAFLVGLADDLRPRGLAPLPKLLLQAAALLPLAFSSGSPALGGAVLVLGLAALNAANTFDNSDGALASLSLVGLAPVRPFAAAAVLGFLPANLDRWRHRGSGPTAYLGDSGSHVLGVLLLAHPVSLAALWVPALDLGRLSLVRWRAGSRPWKADRRHLAHRLESRGLGPLAIGATTGFLALPGCLGVALAREAPWAAAAGLLGGAGLYALLLAFSRPRERADS